MRGGGAQHAFPYHAGILQCSSYSPGCSHPRQAVSCSLAGFITSRRGTKVFQNHLPLLCVEPVGLGGQGVGGEVAPPLRVPTSQWGWGLFGHAAQTRECQRPPSIPSRLDFTPFGVQAARRAWTRCGMVMVAGRTQGLLLLSPARGGREPRGPPGSCFPRHGPFLLLLRLRAWRRVG